MGPHTVVNGANGSVTWCQGPPFCPECVQGARACDQVWPALVRVRPADEPRAPWVVNVAATRPTAH